MSKGGVMVRGFDLTFDHIHVYCSDLDATEKWFTACLDAELLRRRTNRGAPACDLRLGGMTLFLRGQQEDETIANPGPKHFGTDHFGFRVRDLASAASELKRRGVEFDVEPYETRPGLRVAFVRGPDDIRIELLQYDE
jgi:lactoylglutathione lyase